LAAAKRRIAQLAASRLMLGVIALVTFLLLARAFRSLTPSSR